MPTTTQTRLSTFLLFWEDYFKTLCDKSNPRAEERRQEREERRRARGKTDPYSLHRKAVTFNRESLLCFLSIALLMGLTPQPSTSHYWMRDHDIYGSSFISSIMSRDSWVEMKRALTFNEEDLCDHINERFKEFWIP